MKNIILYSVIFLLIFSCGKKEKTSEQITERIEKNVSEELENNIQKIVFISYLEDLKIQRVKEIITVYYKNYYYPDRNFDKSGDYQEVINSISNKYNLSSRKVASVLFAYVYEVRTKEEIGEEYIEQLQEIEDSYYDYGNR